jgi:hypothetical protein
MKNFIKDLITLILFFWLLSALWGEDLRVGKRVYKNFEILTIADKWVNIVYDGGAARLEIKDLPGIWKQYIVDHKAELSVQPDSIKGIKEYREVKDGATYKEPDPIIKPIEPTKVFNIQDLWLKKELEGYERDYKTLKDKLSNEKNKLEKLNIKDQMKDLELYIAQVKKQIEILNKNN